MSKKKKAEDEATPKKKIYGDPEYSAADDIYSKGEKIDLDEEGDLKAAGKKSGKNITGDDLDIPGSEADDTNEEIGEEDEENNYYSLGGDDHENLEEDKGE